MDYKRRIVAEFSARNKAAGEMAAFRRDIDRTGRSVKRMAGSIARIAGVGGGIYGLAYGVRASVREFASFEKQMAQVSTMLDEQSMRYMPQYNKQLRQMSIEMGESTETLSKGLYDILSASVAPAKALKVLAVSTRAAKAGITDTGVAADAITTILNSYGMAAERAGEVSDDLFAIVKRGKTTFGELAPNIGKVSALAATAGLSFDDLGATIATLTRSGIQTELAMTGVRSMITQFIKPTDEARRVAAEFGLVLDSNTLKTIGLTGVFGKLKKATIEQLTTLMPNVRGMASFAAGIRQAEGAAADYEFMLNSAGQTEKAYQKIADTTATKLERLKEKWVSLKRWVGETIVDAADEIARMKKDVNDISGALGLGGGTKYGRFGGGISTKPSGGYKGPIPVIGIPNRPIDPEAAMRSRLPSPYPESPYRMGGSQADRPGSDLVRQMEELREQQRLYDAHRKTFDKKLAEREPKTFVQITMEEGAARREAAQAAEEHLRRVTEAEQQAASDRARAVARMYDTIRVYDRDAYNAKRSLLDQELEEFRRLKIAETDITRYELEMQRQLHLEFAREGDDLAKGFRAQWAELKLNRLTWGEVGANTADTIHAEWVGAFQDMGTEGAKWSDAMEGFFKNVGDSFSNMMAQMAAEALLFKAMMPAFGAIFDAVFPSKGSRYTGTAPANFTNRPGIIEGPAAAGTIATQPTFGLYGEAGPEAILPLQRGPGGRLGVAAVGGGGSTVIHLHNEGPDLNVDRITTQRDAEREVKHIWLKLADNDPAVRRRLGR